MTERSRDRPGVDTLDGDHLPDPKKLLAEFGLVPREALGQNFLRNRGIAEKIVDVLEPARDETVVEIGAGLGHLTVSLARRAQKVVAIEIDRGLASVLREVTRSFSNVEVVVADAASCDYGQLPVDTPDKVVVAGNLPFNRSTDIYFKLVDELPRARQMVLMFQREVAQRLTASPGSRTFGAPSVTSAVKAEVTTCFHVRPGSFHPRPQVQATVLKVVPRRPPLLDPCCLVHLRRLTKVAFGQRRKTIRNALKAGGLSYLLTETDDSLTKEAVSDRRPEALTVEQYIVMARAMCEQSGRCRAASVNGT